MGYILRKTKELAIDYKKITGRSLGITGEVSEYEAAIKMNCTLCEAGKAGHDLIDCNGKRVQVKGRVLGENIQRVGAIEPNTTQKPWDYVLLVILDEQYNVISIYKAEEDNIENEINRPRPRNGKKRRNLTVPDFVRVSQKVWPVSGLSAINR